MVEDVFSTIFPALFRAVSTGDVNVEGQLEHMIVAIDPKDRAAVSGLIQKLASMHELEDMRASLFASGNNILEREGARKGPRHLEFYSKVADLINYFLSSSVLGDARSQVASFFKNPLFTEGVKKIAEDIFGYGSADNYVQKAKNFFATTIDATKNLNTLFRKDSQGVYKLILDITFNVYKQTDIEITESNYKELFKNIKFFVVDGSIKSLSQLSKDDIKGSWAIVHRKHQGIFENGLILVNKPQLDLKLLGIQEGYKIIGTDEVPIEGVFINKYDSKTDKSYLLVGPVRLNPNTKVLERVSDDRIAWLLDSSIKEESFRLVGASEIDKYYAFKYLRSACQKLGSQLTFVLQEVDSRIIPTGAHKKIVSGITAIKAFRLSSRKIVLNPDRYNVAGMNQKISALCNVIYQLGGEFAMTRVYQNFQAPKITPKIFVTEEFFNLHSKDRKYSIPYFKEMIAKLKPTSSDPLHNPSDPLFSGNWYRFLARFSLDDAGNTLSNGLMKETFYKNWLTIIKNDLKRDDPSGYFEKFSILSGFDFHGNFKDEINHQTIKLIDNALIEVFGYPTYICLLTGILAITEDSKGNIKLNFLLHTEREQGNLISNWNLRPLYYPSRSMKYDKLGRKGIVNGISYHYPAILFMSFFTSGFFHFISTDTSLEYKITVSSSQFLDSYFSVFKPTLKKHYTSIYKILLANEFSDYMSQSYVDKKNFNGREKIEELLYKRIKVAIETIFGDKLLTTKYPQFSGQYRESWKIRTEKMAQSLVRTYVDSPSGTYDFALQLRDILFSGKDGYITLQASSTGATTGKAIINSKIFGANELINKGFKIFIPYAEAIKYAKDISFTLNFRGKDGLEGYRLLFEQFTAEQKLKFMDMYNNYYDLFSQGPCDEYKIIFTTEKGRGIPLTGSFHKTYKDLGFKKSSIQFSRTDPQALQEAVASMVFYLFTVPHAFAVVKAGIVGKIDSYNYFFGDIYGLYDYKYIKSSQYAAKNVYGGEFIWSSEWDDGSGNWKQADYDIWKQKFAGVFKPTDIRLFLSFENREGISMLDYLMRLFNNWFSQNSKEPKLNMFDKIADLRDLP